MKDFGFPTVLNKLPLIFLLFVLGLSSGFVFGSIVFKFDREVYQILVEVWSKRVLFGANYLGGNYGVWFILNNLMVMALLVGVSLLFMMFVLYRKKSFWVKKFGDREARHPKLILLSLYILVVGTVVMNGFMISLFLSGIFLQDGFQNLKLAIFILLPHGLSEVLALSLSSSLGLIYIEKLKPLILKRKFEDAVATAKLLLRMPTTKFTLALIIILVIFSGFLEGSLSVLFK